jgi:hypothetical protein
MEPLAVDLRILRSLLLPEMRIVPGRALMARVVNADGNGRGALSIAGYLLDAELPKHVAAGQDLRLVVREVSAERVLLAIAHPDAQPPPAPPPAPAVPLPGGGTIRVQEEDAPGGGTGASADTHSVALRYDAPALGPVDLRFELDPGGLRLAITVSPAALDAARGDAGPLQTALATAVGADAAVTVTARREPLDVYA